MAIPIYKKYGVSSEDIEVENVTACKKLVRYEVQVNMISSSSSSSSS